MKVEGMTRTNKGGKEVWTSKRELNEKSYKVDNGMYVCSRDTAMSCVPKTKKHTQNPNHTPLRVRTSQKVLEKMSEMHFSSFIFFISSKKWLLGEEDGGFITPFLAHHPMWYFTVCIKTEGITCGRVSRDERALPIKENMRMDVYIIYLEKKKSSGPLQRIAP